MSIIIGLFILGAVLTLASFVFSLVLGIIGAAFAGIFALFAWMFKRR